VVVGAPLANRTRPELEGLLGYFVNVVALRTDVSGARPSSACTHVVSNARVLMMDHVSSVSGTPAEEGTVTDSAVTAPLAGDPRLADLLSRTKAVVQGALENADVPFQQVVADASVPRSKSYTPLFQNLFTLADASFESAVELEGATVKEAEVRHAWPGCMPQLTACCCLGCSSFLVRGELSCGMRGMPRQVAADSVQFDLVLSMGEEGDTLRGQLIFTADLFTRATAKRMAEHYMVRAKSAGHRSLVGSTGLPCMRNTDVVTRIELMVCSMVAGSSGEHCGRPRHADPEPQYNEHGRAPAR